MNDTGLLRPVGETVGGMVLAGAPWWLPVIVEINALVGLMTGICGLIIALYGVIALWRRGRPE